MPDAPQTLVKVVVYGLEPVTLADGTTSSCYRNPNVGAVAVPSGGTVQDLMDAVGTIYEAAANGVPGLETPTMFFWMTTPLTDDLPVDRWGEGTAVMTPLATPMVLLSEAVGETREVHVCYFENACE